MVGLYITACGSGAKSVGGRKNAVSTIERRLSALVWAYMQRRLSLDRRDRHIATVLAAIRNTHSAPLRQQEAILPEDLLVMLETCDPSSQGLLFRRITGGERSQDQSASMTVRPPGYRADLPEKDRTALLSGHSLRAGLASSAEVEERHVQKQLGHASVEMTRRYQRRRDRFRENLTKAAGL